MKKRKTTPVVHKSKKQKSIKHAGIKRSLRKRRPIHKRIMLHPASVFMLLCVGVFLVGWTLKTFAENLTVTASVLAPLPSQAAIITKPVQQIHYTTSSITVSGTCPVNNYIKLYRNGIFSGTTICSSLGSFTLLTDLSFGTNLLQAKVFNITNNEGPKSDVITVWYDKPALKSVPKHLTIQNKLVVSSIDNVSVVTGLVHRISVSPTVRGTGPPNSLIIATFHSTPTTCKTYADANGDWSCTLASKLPYGNHTVDNVAITPAGETLTYPTLDLNASGSVVSLQPVEKPNPAFTINYTYAYQVYTSDKQYSWNFSLNNGVGPYAITIDWGDGSGSTIPRNDTSAFQVNHTYELVGITKNNYTIIIKAVDSAGSATSMQLPALVTTDGTQFTAMLMTQGGAYQSLLNFTKRWLWVVWPFYLVVLLMTTSFWLGEREEYIKIINSARRHKRRLVRQS